MGSPQVHVLDSFQDIAAMADRWNDLWQRSDVTSPVMRAETLGNWLDCFAPEQEFRAVVVEHQDRLLAALPLVEQKWARFITTGGLPVNEWSMAGDLLLDRAEEAADAAGRIAGTLNRLGWPLFRLSFVRTGAPDWHTMQHALADAGLQVECRPLFEVPLIDIPADWEAYRRSWSKNHRHRVGGRLRRLKEQGEVRLNRLVPASWAEAAPVLEQAFQIEDSGWKGRAGTSLLRAPGIAAYVRTLTALLAPRGEVEFAFLELNGQAIACEILLHAKGVLHSYKVGYDEQYQWYDPGHLLMHELLLEASVTQRCRGYDCMGPNNVGLRRWRGTAQAVGQLVMAPAKWYAPALMFAYRRWRRPIAPAESWDDSVDSHDDSPARRTPAEQGAGV
jgi:CelD/BcsL family acetyltransferase involved in cellulose biosynthesis